MQHPIQILSSSAFMGHDPTHQPASNQSVFKGKIRLTTNPEERAIACYIKPLPDCIHKGAQLVTNRELLNEALGYTLAHRSGHAVPAHAGIIALDQQQIPSQTLRRVKRMTPRTKPQNDYLAWFSADMKSPSLLENAGSDPTLPQMREIVDQLTQHKQTSSVVAFDEWMENTDRNLGNLLVCGKDLVLIDHGYLLRGQWQPSQLKRPKRARNVLRELICHFRPDWRPSQKASWRKLQTAWSANKTRSFAQIVLNDFLEKENTEQVIAFLEQRLQQRPNLV